MLECEKRCGVFDVKFLDGGSTIMAAANIGIVMYDLVKMKKIAEIKDAHWEDVTSITFSGDPDSSNILITGGDDGIANMWDKRLL
jgi:WD40 repeat protein